MKSRRDIACRRQLQQQIAAPSLKAPADVVRLLCAVQAQDYRGALWAVGLRMQEATERDIEQALDDRSIVRSWPMRGTLHFVAAGDLRWMLELLTPRMVARGALRDRQLRLDDATYSRSRKILTKALEGGRQYSREKMYDLLEKGRVSTAGQRGIHILARLAQEGVLCFGARAGQQHTFTLLEEWIPSSRRLPREEALANLAERYFSGHGPATLRDFIWWSGLTAADAKAGLEMAKHRLASEVIEGLQFWLSPHSPSRKAGATAFALLPAFDEFLVGYKDRSAALDPKDARRINAGGGMLSPALLADGRITGVWRRTIKKDTVLVQASPFTTFTRVQERAMVEAARRYGRFIGRPITALEQLKTLPRGKTA